MREWREPLNFLVKFNRLSIVFKNHEIFTYAFLGILGAFLPSLQAVTDKVGVRPVYSTVWDLGHFRQYWRGAGPTFRGRRPNLLVSNKAQPSQGAFFLMAERTGLEPATSGVTGRHSNQLSYIPAQAAGV